MLKTGMKSVLDILCFKHPGASPEGGSADPPSVHPVLYDQITANSIRSAPTGGSLRKQFSEPPKATSKRRLALDNFVLGK